MRLNELFSGIPRTLAAGTLDHEIAGVSCDSRKTAVGEVFFALPGSRTDGNLHIKEALSKGACAVVSEQMPPPAPFGIAATWIQVPDAQSALAMASAEFYGHPSRKMQVIGITGTNGKTTTSYFLESIYRCAGRKPGVIGTINYRVDGEIISKAPNTTPISLELQKLLKRVEERGAKAVMMEVSSHSLALKRVDEISFDAAVFTNLYRDHLDFHNDRDEYFSAKLRLFSLLQNGAHPKTPRYAVVNSDDERAPQILSSLRAPVRSLTYGLDRRCDWSASGLNAGVDGTEFTLRCPSGEHKVKLQLLGKYNVYNAMAAAAAATALGVPVECAIKGMQSLETVPGRLEAVKIKPGYNVFVDYAHTDSALEQVLNNLQELPHKKIITVFGCGGDRDRTKRAPMGIAACSKSDHTIITSDNPRSEDPARILRDIEDGLKKEGISNYRLIPDRREAIFTAVKTARPGDIVLIAGKGHEDYQILADRTIHFDDREVAAEAIRAR